MFVKFNSIDNFYLHEQDDLMSIPRKAVITEKIDGSNMCVFLGEKIQIFTRNGNEFTKEKVDWLIPKFEKLRKFLGRDLILYGELYGKSIVNRLNYPDDVAFLAYTAREIGADTYYSPVWVEKLLSSANCGIKCVKMSVVDDFSINTVEKYCILPHKSNYTIGNDTNSHLEGYVIYFVDDDNQVIEMIKRKDESFFDKKQQRIGKDLIEATKDNQIFRGYLTYNRALDTYVKFGANPTINRAILCRAMIEDAKEDFLKDYPEIKILSKLDQRRIFNAGRLPYTLFEKIIGASNQQLA